MPNNFVPVPPFPILVPGTGPSSTTPLLEEGAVNSTTITAHELAASKVG